MSTFVSGGFLDVDDDDDEVWFHGGRFIRAVEASWTLMTIMMRFGFMVVVLFVRCHSQTRRTRRGLGRVDGNWDQWEVKPFDV